MWLSMPLVPDPPWPPFASMWVYDTPHLFMTAYVRGVFVRAAYWFIMRFFKDLYIFNKAWEKKKSYMRV